MGRTCNKVAYFTKAEATKDSKHILVQRRDRKAAKAGKKLRAYICLDCGMWHLTSMSKKFSRKVFKHD